MRRHQLLMASLALFAMGIGCQLYSMFDPTQPYMQQMSFMFVAMPSAMAILHHYYYHYQDPPPSEEKLTNLPNTAMASDAPQSHKRVLNQPIKHAPTHHVADTSLPPSKPQQKQQHRRTLSSSGAQHLSCYDDESAAEGTELLFGEFR